MAVLRGGGGIDYVMKVLTVSQEFSEGVHVDRSGCWVVF